MELMIRKIITLFISVSLVLSSLGVYASSSGVVSDTEKKLELLSTFGIFAQADVNDTTAWTREQFVQSCAGLIGINAKADPINAMINQGVIKGDGSTLNLDENIKFVDALVMVVRVLGYEDMVQSKGGYPSGYLNIAMSNDMYIKDNIYSDVVTEDVINLFYDAIFVPVMDIESISSGGIGYVIDEDVTVLNKYFNIEKIEGRVTSVDDAAIGISSVAGDGKVIIDNVRYDVGETDMASYIGYNVIAYADMNSSVPEIIWVQTDESMTKVLVLNSDEISDVKGFDDDDTSSQKTSPYVEYEAGDKIKKLSIDTECDVLYNGVISHSLSDSALMPKVGYVSFIDADSDGKIDFLNIVSYEVFIVDYNSPEMGTMAFINSGYTLDTNREYKSVTKNGVEISIDSIQSGDSVHIGTELLKSGETLNDAEYISIVCVTDSFSGKITGLSPKTVVIDEKEYEISSAFDDSADMKIGKKYIFYKDIDGKIVEADEISGEGINYGYLNAAKRENMKEDEVLLQIFTKSNEFEEFRLSKKVRYITDDTDANLSASDLYSVIAPNGTVTKQVVRFNLNASGEINELRFVIDKTTDSSYRGVDYDNFTLDEKGRMRIYTSSVGRNFMLGDITTVIMIPNSGEEDEFTGGGSGLVGGGDFWYDDVCVYDVNENGKIGLLTVPISNKKTEGPSNAIEESNFIVIDSVTQAVVNGEEVYKIYGWQGKKEVAYTTVDTDVKDNGGTHWADSNTKRHVSELTRGDVIQLGTDRNGFVDSIWILLSFDGDIPTTPRYIEGSPNDTYTSLLNTAYGQVLDNIDGDFLRVSSDKTRLYAVKNVNLYVYDMQKDEVRLGSPQEVTTNDWVFIRNRRAVCHEVVVFRR